MVSLTCRVWKNDSVSAYILNRTIAKRYPLSQALIITRELSLRKQVTFGDATIGFSGGETSGSVAVAKCRLFEASENVD